MRWFDRPSPSWRALAWIGLVLALMAVHVTLGGHERAHHPFLNLVLMAVIQAMAVGAVLLRWRRSVGEARLLWLLMALAMLLQLLSSLMTLSSVLAPAGTAHAFEVQAALLSGLYMVPLMFMIARTFSRDMPRLVHVLDSLMVGCVAALLIALIYYMDTTAEAVVAVHVRELVFLADAVNYSLAILVTIRLLGALTAMRRQVYLATAAFLWIHVLAVSGVNRLSGSGLPWWLDAMTDAAFVAVMILSLLPTPRWLRRMHTPRQVAGVIDGFAPIVLTISVLALGISVSRLNFGAGMIVSVLSVLFYGLRMAYLHSRDRDRERAVTQSNLRLQERLGMDPLTGIANRVTLDVRLPSLLGAARTSNSPCSLLMIDIDFFKQYNDHFGHIAGDHCLRDVVVALQEGLLRAGDLISRYGGEEFVAVLPDTTERAARVVAERLVGKVAECGLPHPVSPYERVTVSVGVATCTSCQPSMALELLDMADRALYRAKRKGRNRIAGAEAEADSWPDPSPPAAAD